MKIFIFVCLQPVTLPYDHTIDECELSVEQWKELIYQEVLTFTANTQPLH